MSTRRSPGEDEWQLGPAPQAAEELKPTTVTDKGRNLTTERLSRPVGVITVEHLAWSAIALWTVITRLVLLRMAPLAPLESRHALFEYDLINGTDLASAVGYHPASAGWVHLLEAGVMALGGATDFTARLIFVLSGVAIIAVIFRMRPFVGRAGAIVAAAVIATSPTFTYFSRASAMSIMAATAAMVVIETFMTLTQRPSFTRAVILGCACGILCATGLPGMAAGGALLAALALLGVSQLLVTRRAILNARVWLVRHAPGVVAAIIAGGVSWLASEMSLFKPMAVVRNVERLWNDVRAPDYLASLRHYATGIVLYEFLITLVAITGLIAIFSLRAWSRFTFFSLLWLLMSCAYFFGSRERDCERLVLILLPLVMTGAIGVGYWHGTRTWPYLRLVLVLCSAATVYVQVEANFFYPAPDANETPWTRHANLYWRDGATPIQARDLLKAIRHRFPKEGGTVLNRGMWQPSLRWYLRDFRSTSTAKLADLIVGPNAQRFTAGDSNLEAPASLEIEESWDPTISTLTAGDAFRFVFRAVAWSPLRSDTIALAVRPALDLAPTLIIPPH
jgi:hypothetical protein